MKRSPLLAGILGIIFPGAGLLYNNRILEAIMMFFFIIIGYIFCIIPGILLHVSSVSKAYSDASRYNAELMQRINKGEV
jgi:TM2 domain-containing membrane protein YozV